MVDLLIAVNYAVILTNDGIDRMEDVFIHGACAGLQEVSRFAESRPATSADRHITMCRRILIDHYQSACHYVPPLC